VRRRYQAPQGAVIKQDAGMRGFFPCALQFRKIRAEAESGEVGANDDSRSFPMSAKTMAMLAAMAAVGGGTIPAAVAFGGGRAASSHTVVLRHNQFMPGTESIRRGESVTWLWRDGGTLHNVIGHGFQSRTQTHGSSTVRFTRSGTFSYTCTVHPHMNGRVIVH
jgi:plastocyanin